MPAAKKTTARKATPAKKATAAKSKAAAASQEAGGERSLDWRGLTFTLPATLPGTLIFDLAEVEKNPNALGPLIATLESLLGAEQLRQVRDLVASENIDMAGVADVLGDLVREVFGSYGMTEGESSASPGS